MESMRVEKPVWGCPKCGEGLVRELDAGIDYPLLCENCDENFYFIEAVSRAERRELV